MDQFSLIGRVLYWSSSLTAEQKLLYYTVCIDPLLSDFYWTPEFRGLAEGLLRGSSNLVFLVGLQGVGLLVYLCFILRYGWGYVDL
jgi:hypothetical protein